MTDEQRAIRARRRYADTPVDQRSAFARDRDRILYSSAFRRLSGITQIVRANENDAFHTRALHTLKVAQVGRRLAEHARLAQPQEANALGLDVEVVEAACFAHDLGHPPFGHAGEHTLDALVRQAGNPDGFDGNAQSFRTVTKLAVQSDSFTGLNLTAATLAAIQKYPWTRDPAHGKRSRKWGSYVTEATDFAFAYDATRWNGERSLEAEIMDWADDVAYTVHDLEDFHRTNGIPWHVILSKEGESEIVRRAVAAWTNGPDDAAERLGAAYARLKRLLTDPVRFPTFTRHPYDASRSHRRQVSTALAVLVGRFFRGITIRFDGFPLDGPCVAFSERLRDELNVLKRITQFYVIANPSLVAQQTGQSRVLAELFADIFEEVRIHRGRRLMPLRFRHLLDDAQREEGYASDDARAARITADALASMTEAEVSAFHARLRGHNAGSVLDPIFR